MATISPQEAADLAQAAKYVQSLLPDKLKKGPILSDWRFVPSASLGGDSFGYHWLDDDHLFITHSAEHVQSCYDVHSHSRVRAAACGDADVRARGTRAASQLVVTDDLQRRLR